MAWRNMWRNRKRSLITMTSIVMAVALSILYAATKDGSMNAMVDAVVQRSGNIAIHKKGYWDQRSINNSFVLNSDVNQAISEEENISMLIPRLDNFALVSTGDRTKGAMITGVIPEYENQQSKLAEKIVTGSYFNDENDQGIIVAKELAKYLRLIEESEEGINLLQDTLVVYGSGYQGVTAAAKFPVRGIVDLPTPIENKGATYITLSNAQYTFSPYVPNIVSSVAVYLNDDTQITESQDVLLSELNPEKFEVMRWDERNPEIIQSIEMEDISRLIIMGIIYLIVGLGMFGTILMSSMERKKELAVMQAVGMSKNKISLMLWVESILIGLCGSVMGSLLMWPVISHFHHNPVPLTGEMAEGMAMYNLPPYMQFAYNADMFVSQTIIVFIMALIAAIYPIWSIRQTKITEAFHK